MLCLVSIDEMLSIILLLAFLSSAYVYLRHKVMELREAKLKAEYGWMAEVVAYECYLNHYLPGHYEGNWSDYGCVGWGHTIQCGSAHKTITLNVMGPVEERMCG